MPRCLITGCILFNKDTKESWRGDLHEVGGALVVNANENSKVVGDVNDEDKVVWFTSQCDLFERRGMFVLPVTGFYITWGLNEVAKLYLHNR